MNNSELLSFDNSLIDVNVKINNKSVEIKSNSAFFYFDFVCNFDKVLLKQIITSETKKFLKQNKSFTGKYKLFKDTIYTKLRTIQKETK